MNFIDRFLVFIVLLPKGFYKSFGVNYNQLKTILKYKNIMGDRTPKGINALRKTNQNKPTSNVSYFQTFLSIFLGLMFMFSFYIGVNYETKLTIYFSMYMFILASTLIADFTTVLIDVRDNFIILPKPINDKTFLLSRLLYIIIHIVKTALPMTLLGLIYMGYYNGLWALFTFFILILFATLFTVFLINTIYILVLKITTPNKFKSFISYFQILITILLYAGYQIIPKIISQSTLQGINFNLSNFSMFVPSYWFGAAWQFLNSFENSFKLIVCTVLALTIPVLSIWVVIQYLAPSFNKKLALIGNSTEEEKVVKSNLKPVKFTSNYLRFFSAIFTAKGAERMSFIHTWKMTSRSRDFKMKVYPSLGYLLVYLVLVFLKNDGGYGIQFPEADSFFYIFVVYFCNFILITALGYLSFSDKYKAAWIYYVSPIDKPGKLQLGAVKSLLTKFYLPLAALILILVFMFLKLSYLPNYILGISNQILIVLSIAYISFKDLPFSASAGNKVKGSSFVRGIFTLLIPLSFGGIHYLIRDFLPVVILLIILSFIAIWMVLDSIKNRSWEQIKTQSEF